MSTRTLRYFFASVLLLFLSGSCTQRGEEPRDVLYPSPVRIGFCLRSPLSIPHIPESDLLLVDATMWGRGDRARVASLLRNWQNILIRVQVLQGGPGSGELTFQRTRSGAPARLAERNLLFPGVKAAARIRETLADWQRRGAPEGMVIRDPFYAATAGFGEPFLAEWRRSSGFAGFPDDSASAWWSAAQKKQRMLHEFLRRLAEWPEGHRMRLYVELPSPIEAGKAAMVLPHPDSLRPHFGILGRVLSRWNRTGLLFQGKRQIRLFAESYTNTSWWKSAVPPDSTFWLVVELPERMARVPGEWLRAMKLVAAALFLQGEDRNLILPLPDFPSPRSIPLYRFLGTLAFLLKVSEGIPFDEWHWLGFPWPRTGILFDASFLYQIGSPWQLDISAFYELLLPFLYGGVPVEVVPLNRLLEPLFLNRFHVLVGSYEAYRPTVPHVNQALERWVRRSGGILFFYTGQTGPFDELESWWSNEYDRPHESLFDQTGVGLYPEAGFHKVGKGVIYTERSSPAELAAMPQSGKIFWNSFLSILQLVAPDSSRFSAPPILHRARGPFHLVFIPREASGGMAKSTVLEGRWIRLWDEGFPVVRNPRILPEAPELLVNLEDIPEDTAAVLAAHGSISHFSVDSLEISFVLHPFPGIPADVVVRLPSRPARVNLTGTKNGASSLQQTWDPQESLLRLRFTPQQRRITIRIFLDR